MVARFDKAQLIARKEIVAPLAPRACEDRTFELPPALHIAMAALFLGFVGILSFAFRNPEMVVPFAVFAIFIAAFFTVPGLWTRMAPMESRTSALSWSQLAEQGIAIEHGRCSGKEATVLALLLPFLIFCWAIAVAIIAAVV